MPGRKPSTSLAFRLKERRMYDVLRRTVLSLAARLGAHRFFIGILAMHASIVLFVMMVGGPVSPEPEIVTVPLRDDISNPSSIQEMELRERAKAHPLPPVPTIDPSQQTGNGGERPPAMPYAPTDRNAPRPSQPIMPQAPDLGGCPAWPYALPAGRWRCAAQSVRQRQPDGGCPPQRSLFECPSSGT